MKRLLGFSLVAAFVLALPASHIVMGKAHVPAHKEQVCHAGEVIAVGAQAVDAHLSHGDCFIDKRTHLPPLFTRDACTSSDCS